MTEPAEYQALADAAWRWVLAQVRDDDGPWIPATGTGPEGPGEPPWDRDGMHSGIGGLALALAEIRLARPWTDEESDLADRVAERIRRGLGTSTDYTYFDGLVSAIGVLTALEAPGAEAAVARLAELATPDGWPQTSYGPPRFEPGTRVTDLTLGTAGVLLGALWARRQGTPGAEALATLAVDVLLAEAEPVPTGTNWRFVPERFRNDPGAQMPNLSHGLAGIALPLALAGAELGRPELVDAARSGAEHLVSLADTGKQGFRVPLSIPANLDFEEYMYGWCHGASGTSLLFAALDHAGVADVAGRSPDEWRRRCFRSVRDSGLPARIRPGFWDNDGRCCGTVSVGEVHLDAWQRDDDDAHHRFALVLADTLVDHAVRDGDDVYWRFVEHRAPEPLLPPGVGWMQGAAGIAAYLFRVSRLVVEGPEAPAVARMDNWWALPTGVA